MIHPSKDIFIARQGDTLARIAAEVYGDAEMWRGIAELNGIRDPNFIRMGDEIRLP